jgi:serine/threonine-protein kinase RsbW
MGVCGTMNKETAKMTLPAELENLELMIKFIRNGVGKLGFDGKEMNRIQLASEEVLMNVISHAYPDSSGDVEITYHIRDDKSLVIEVVDWGISFDPLSAPEPDIEASVEDRVIGGLGIYMMRNIMDEAHYERVGNRNILTLVKH